MYNNIKFILIPAITLIFCQIIKFAIDSIKNKKLMWGRLFNGSGGMPSSHTSFSTSLAFLMGINFGFDSVFFAVPLVFTMITAYDAMGLRMQTGMQAEAINWIVDELFEKGAKVGYKKLKEEVGHKPLEVFGGILLGIISACVFNMIF